MLQTPQIKTHLSVHIIPGQGALVLTEGSTRALHGTLYEHVLPLVDGRRRTEDIVLALAPQVDPARVYYALLQLEKNGHLREATPQVPAHLAALWDELGRDPAAAQQALEATRLCLHATAGAPGVQVLRAALQAVGFAGVMSYVEPMEPDGDGLLDPHALHVVLTHDYLDDALAVFNRRARAVGASWLPVRLGGPEVWAGPLYAGEARPCHACLARRLRRNRLAHTFLAETQAGGAMPRTARAAHPALLNMGAHWVAMELLRTVGANAVRLHERVLSVDHLSGQMAEHRLLAHPACPDCGGVPAPRDPRVTLQSRHVAFSADGGHRIVSPDITLQKYRHHISPITGVVRGLTDMTPDGSVARVFAAGHNPVLRVTKLAELKAGLRSGSSGKGVSTTQAQVSALCEAIERYSGEWHGDPGRITLSWNGMRERFGADAIHPNAVMNFSEAQYAGREAQNARGSRFNFVPEPLPDDTPVDWTALWSLTHERVKYLPTQLVSFHAPAREGDKTRYCHGCSNGNASGNTLEEAILQGFFELVERDAVALWWYNRLRRPAIDLRSLDDGHLPVLMDEYRRKGRECWALDLSSDLGIPVVVALSRATGQAQESILMGLGCHFDPRIAAQRAFAEMNQMLWMAMPDPQGGNLTIEDEEARSWLERATLATDPYLVPAPGQPQRPIGNLPNHASGDLLRDIARCREIVESRGMEMLVLDQTRPDIGMPVVKVVVPGLRHFWARYAPGRLFDVPVRQGWLDRALAEHELNPVPVFV